MQGFLLFVGRGLAPAVKTDSRGRLSLQFVGAFNERPYGE